jgi:hypothetical protein
MAKAKSETGITKMEGVKRALANLGTDAKVHDIQAYVKQHFGIEISTGVIYTYKNDLVKKAKDAKQPAPKSRSTSANGLTKMGAVRQALSELGKSAKPLDIQKFVKERFNITMTVAHISNYKTTILAKKKRKAAARMAKGDVVASLAQPAPVTREAPKPGTGVTLDNLRALKELLGKVGADNLKELIDIVK